MAEKKQCASCKGWLTPWQRRPGKHICPVFAAEPLNKHWCPVCRQYFKNPSALSRHRSSCAASAIHLAAAAAVVSPPPAVIVDDEGGRMDEDDDSPIVLAPPAAVSAPLIPPPPPSPPLQSSLEKLEANLRSHRIFMAAWSMKHNITATAMDQLLLEQSSLLESLHVLEKKKKKKRKSTKDSFINNSMPTLDIESWPITTQRLLGSVVAPDAVSFQSYALCPDSNCGRMILLGENGKLPLDHRTCRRPIDQITERPKQMDEDEEQREREQQFEQAKDQAKNKQMEQERKNEQPNLDMIPVSSTVDGVRRSTRSLKPTAAAAAAAASVAPAAASPPLLCETILTGRCSKEDEKKEFPQLVFSYRPLHLSLQQLLSRPGLEQKCELWRHRYDQHESDGRTRKRLQDDVLSDIWDGRMWERYQYLTKDYRPWDELVATDRIEFNKLVVKEKEDRDACKRAPADVNAREIWIASMKAKSDWPKVESDPETDAEPEEEEKSSDREKRRVNKQFPLLAQAGTLALALNIDWFQPFQGQQYSMGAMYMTIQNLPREERYLEENMILVGILPGPDETSRTQLQGACKPLRDELLNLLHGVQMKTADHPDGTHAVRAFLLDNVCDRPASCGLNGYAQGNTLNGCPHCDFGFDARAGSSHRDWRPRKDPITKQPVDDWNVWKKRTHASQLIKARAWVHSIMNAKKSSQRLKYQRNILNCQANEFQIHGTRWSWLLDLPYWDTQRGMTIDVMHNIFLGTCKHIMAMMTGKEDTTEERIKKGQRKKEEKILKQAAKEKERLVNIAAKEKAAREATVSAAIASAVVSSDDDLSDADISTDDEADLRSDGNESDEEITRRRVKKRQAEVKEKMEKKKKKKKVLPAVAAAAPADRIILNLADRQTIQRFLNQAKCPRDIGRIQNKIVTLSSVKANEWMNFFGIFAVPAIRELMRAGHSRLTTVHLQIFILLQRIVTTLRAYIITKAEIVQVNLQLKQLVELVSNCWPLNDGSITPNMHLSLHLEDQLFDFGPPAGWWCQAYERFNGLISRIPFSRSAPTTVAKRVWSIIAVAGAAAYEYAASSMDDRNLNQHLRGQSIPRSLVSTHDGGFTHQIITSTSNGREHVYQWIDGPHRILKWKQFSNMRNGLTKEDVIGNEPFPGSFVVERNAAAPTVKLDFIGVPQIFLDVARRKSILTGLPSSISLTRMEHVRACLHVHYLVAYGEEIIDNNVFELSDGEILAIKADRIKEGQTKAQQETNRDKAIVAAAKFFQTLDLQISLYDTLALAGEMYGSAGRGRLVDSCFIAVSFVESKDSSIIWYGRVDYYFTHMYDKVLHHFAVVRYYDWVGTVSRKGVHFSDAMTQYVKPIKNANPNILEETFNSFPVLANHITNSSMQDIIPVQRIMFRWCPSYSDDGKTMIVCPIPCKMHA